MKCIDCPYHWKDDGDDFAQCHFIRMFDPLLDPAPCEASESDCGDTQPDDFP